MVEKNIRGDGVVSMKLDISLEKEPEIEINPLLYDIHKSFNVIRVKNHDGIKGEFLPRMVVFTNFVLGRKPIVLLGPRGSGKSAVLRIVSSYCKNSGEITKASERADYRDVNINKFSHFIIPEINKISESFLEVLKDIGEGESSVYKTLNSFKEPVTYKIDPKPFISSVADENKTKLGEELLSRITTVRVDSSISQNIAVIKYKLERAQNPFARGDVSQKEINLYQRYVKNLPNINDFTFIYLPGKSVLSAVPPFFTDSRRDIDKYLANTHGIALFHYKDRLVVEKHNQKLFLVTPADAWYNHIIFNDVLVQSSLKCSGIEKIILEMLVGSVDEEGECVFLSPQEIHALLVKKGFTPSLPTVKKYCRNLYENGYLIRDDSQKPFKYRGSGDFLEKYKAKIDWKGVISESKKAVTEQFDKKTAEEYIERFCTDPLIVTHPFTGEKINLFEYKEEVQKVNINEVIKNKNNPKNTKNIISYLESEKDHNKNTKETGVDLPEIDGKLEVTEENIGGDEGGETDVEDFFAENANEEGFVDAHVFEDYYGEASTEFHLKSGNIYEVKPGKYKLI